MRFCLWCDEELILQINWNNLFTITSRSKLCEKCHAQLEKLHGKRCMYCSRKDNEKVCNDCLTWQQVYKGSDPLLKNISLYSYNTFMKDIIARWKYRGDYLLGEIFREEYQANFKKNFKDIWEESIIIPIPLSKQRLLERGFNQAAVLAQFLSPVNQPLLQRLHSEKQSKKTRMERMSTKNPFFLTKPIKKRVILVDDIYTTGRTIRHAAQLLKISGCPEVYSYTLIRG